MSINKPNSNYIYAIYNKKFNGYLRKTASTFTRSKTYNYSVLNLKSNSIITKKAEDAWTPKLKYARFFSRQSDANMCLKTFFSGWNSKSEYEDIIIYTFELVKVGESYYNDR